MLTERDRQIQKIRDQFLGPHSSGLGDPCFHNALAKSMVAEAKSGVNEGISKEIEGRKRKVRDEDFQHPTSIPIFPGAKHLFSCQRRGSRGIREATRRNSNRGSLMPSSNEQTVFQKCIPVLDPQYDFRTSLTADDSNSKLSEWLWMLQLNFNILIFGVGAKETFLRTFAKSQLSGEDVMYINGSKFASVGNRCIKQLLDTICGEILKQSEAASFFSSLDSYSTFVAGTFSFVSL